MYYYCVILPCNVTATVSQTDLMSLFTDYRLERQASQLPPQSPVFANLDTEIDTKIDTKGAFLPLPRQPVNPLPLRCIEGEVQEVTVKMGGSDDVDDNEKPVERLEIANNEEEYIHAKHLCKGKLFLLLMTKMERILSLGHKT